MLTSLVPDTGALSPIIDRLTEEDPPAFHTGVAPAALSGLLQDAEHSSPVHHFAVLLSIALRVRKKYCLTNHDSLVKLGSTRAVALLLPGTGGIKVIEKGGQSHSHKRTIVNSGLA